MTAQRLRPDFAAIDERNGMTSAKARRSIHGSDTVRAHGRHPFVQGLQ